MTVRMLTWLSSNQVLWVNQPYWNVFKKIINYLMINLLRRIIKISDENNKPLFYNIKLCLISYFNWLNVFSKAEMLKTDILYITFINFCCNALLFRKKKYSLNLIDMIINERIGVIRIWNKIITHKVVAYTQFPGDIYFNYLKPSA